MYNLAEIVLKVLKITLKKEQHVQERYFMKCLIKYSFEKQIKPVLIDYYKIADKQEKEFINSLVYTDKNPQNEKFI